MSNIPISSLPGANPLTGEEIVPVVQAGTTKRATTGAISALPFGSAAGSPSGISFVTVSSATAALPSSRILAATSPVQLTDSGAGAAITIGLSGVLGVPFGGTGTATIPANRVLIGDTVGTSITAVAAATTDGYLLTAVVGSPPQWQFHSGVGSVTSIGLSGGTTGLSVSNSPITTSGTMTISGTLVVPNGGTGATSLAAHGLLLGNGTGAIAVTAVGTAGQLLVGQGAASDPLWRTPLGDLAMTAGGTATVGNALGHAIVNVPLTTGLITATSATTATQRSIASGSGITVANSDGSAGNPTVSLASIAGLSVLGVAGTGTTAPAAITGAAAQFLGVNAGGTALVFSSVIVTVKKQAFTANGTYTPSTGMLFCLPEGVGGGGGGGGVAGTANAIFIAGGGGSGAYARALLTAAQVGASQVVTIGVAGTGGVTGPNAGGAGGNTSLGSLLVAAGGAGGAATSVAAVGIGGNGGLSASSTGDITAAGAPGEAGFYNTVNLALLLLTGGGGSSHFGGGGRSAANAAGASAGVAASNYGSGGSGGLVNNSVVSTNGGTGSAGVLYITEWCSQ